jgi:cytochrome c553
MERWTFSYKPGEFPAPPQPVNFEFLLPHLSQKELAASRTVNKKGFAQAEIAGMPRLDSAGKVLEDEDDAGNPLCYFTLWQPAAIDGQTWTVGGPDVAVPLSRILKKRAAWGGTLSRLLYAAVLADAKAKGFSAPEMEAWGWLPPALAEEGGKVQPPWLVKYLLSPTPIRPAGVMPMPKFNLSEEDAATLAEFFAAAAINSENALLNPKTQEAGTSTSRLAKAQDQALRFVLESKSSCAKCHLIGDYRPGGDGRTNLAPNLADVGGRLQPRYIHRWLADPRTVLPYTPMPQNFPPQGEPQGQELLPGGSIEQLAAVEQLLIEYDEYAKGKMSIRKMVPQQPIDGL